MAGSGFDPEGVVWTGVVHVHGFMREGCDAARILEGGLASAIPVSGCHPVMSVSFTVVWESSDVRKAVAHDRRVFVLRYICAPCELAVASIVRGVCGVSVQHAVSLVRSTDFAMVAMATVFGSAMVVMYFVASLVGSMVSVTVGSVE